MQNKWGVIVNLTIFINFGIKIILFGYNEITRNNRAAKTAGFEVSFNFLTNSSSQFNQLFSR